MESPQSLQSPLAGISAASRSRSSTKLVDDVTSLTSFNPFSEEDENDQSSYTLVTSIFSRMKNTIAAPLSSAVAAASGSSTATTTMNTQNAGAEPRKPPYNIPQPTQSSLLSRNSTERPQSLVVNPSKPAQPLVSLTPVVSEAPSFHAEYERSPSRSGNFYEDGGLFGGTAIPGFPIQDDARSIRTAASATINRSASVSKVIRRIRGEGKSAVSPLDDA
jgi:1-phosphatidylinositol-3-phosphate 5-kinase